MILRNKLIEDIISGQISEEEHEVVLKTIRRDLSKIFKEIMPKKFWIFLKLLMYIVYLTVYVLKCRVMEAKIIF